MRELRGFTLIELMIVVAVVALIAAIALPSFTAQIRHSRRSAAQAALQQIGLFEERYRADNTAYLGAVPGSWPSNVGSDPGIADKYYTYSVTVTAADTSAKSPCTSPAPAQYTATASATSVGGQIKDNAGGTSCSSLTFGVTWDTANCVLQTVKGANAACWSQ